MAVAHDFSVFFRSKTPWAHAMVEVLRMDGVKPPPDMAPKVPALSLVPPVEKSSAEDTWAQANTPSYRPHASRYHLDSLTSEDVISSFVTIFTDPDEEDLLVIDRVRKLLDQLPVIEADFIDLYFFRHVRQTDIAAIFGVSQPTVCYRLQRAIQRIKYLLKVPKLDPSELRANLRGFFTDPVDIEILVLMYDLTCESATAKKLGVTQGFVRHRFFRSIRKMSQNPAMSFYGEVFSTVSQNLNLLREVQRSYRTIRSGYYIDS